MTELKASTQRAQSMVGAYKSSLLKNGIRDIHKAYGRPSPAKVHAWEDCRKLCLNHKGKNLTVVGGGTYKFSAAFTFSNKGKEYLCYITDCYCYKIALN